MKNKIASMTSVCLFISLSVHSQNIVDLSPKSEPKEPVMHKVKYPIPLEYRHKELFEITFPDFNSLGELKTYGLLLVDDNAAAGGKAMTIGKLGSKVDAESFHKKEFVMGIQGRTSKKNLSFYRIKKDQVPQDEKYHFYSLGRINLEPNTIFWGHSTWFFQQKLGKWYNEKDNSKNRVEVLVSLKLTGPAYVKGSKSENSIFIDRFLLIRP